MSSFTKPLTTTYIGGGFRRVEREFEYHVGKQESNEVILVPKGFLTDFASIPWPISMLIPKDGDYNQPAVLHDYLYSRLGRLYNMTYNRAKCDSVFLEAMEVINLLDNFSIPLLKRRIIYRGVRVGGWYGWRKHEGRRKQK